MASIDKRPNGTWRVRWREVKNGAQKTRTFKRKPDAQRFRTEIEYKLDTGRYRDPALGRVTFRAWAEDVLAQKGRRPATVDAMRRSIALACEAFGDKPLAGIRRSDVAAMLNGLETGPGTARLVRQHVGTVFAEAVKDDAPPFNPWRPRSAPRCPRRHWWSRPSPRCGHSSTPPTTGCPAVVLGALGLRQGEVSGLTWDHVNLPGRTLTVDRQWTRAGMFGPPKTKASHRDVPLPTWAVELLLAAPSRPARGHVVANEGRVVGHTRFNAVWNATRREAGVAIKFHLMRHHFAVELIRAGVPAPLTKTAGGWGSTAILFDTYARFFPADDTLVRSALDAAWAVPSPVLKQPSDGSAHP